MIFRKSHVNLFKICPYKYWCEKNLVKEVEVINGRPLLGSAAHKLLSSYLFHNDSFLEPTAILTDLTQYYSFEIKKVKERYGETLVVNEIDLPFRDYTDKIYYFLQWTKFFERFLVLGRDAKFEFKLSPRRSFVGEIDIIVQEQATGKMGFLDFKFGQKDVVTDHLLSLNRELSIYSYALKYATFYNKTVYGINSEIIGFCYLSDLVPYKRKTKKRISNKTEAAWLGVDIGTEVEFQQGDKRGPALYLTNRSPERLKNFYDELKAITDQMSKQAEKHFWRNDSSRYCPACQYQHFCLNGFVEGQEEKKEVEEINNKLMEVGL